ncbi:hypothetical protein RBWH47_02287 [Rhodopirellula baltica WH47]|uniref:Uncharacterized protein n=1 Tax=Rhodopirellula baltica WH47 TaxID=991778 RepID=F2AZ30_RHOBT|nr:hypothetical protein RBWH47_02287 [Rhodopirellula baltica WH47]
MPQTPTASKPLIDLPCRKPQHLSKLFSKQEAISHLKQNVHVIGHDHEPLEVIPLTIEMPQ